MRNMYLHRTMCDVLHEMRELDKHKNYAPIAGLIEEAQSFANRMEAAIGQLNDIKRINKEWRKAKKKNKKLEKMKKQEKKADV